MKLRNLDKQEKRINSMSETQILLTLKKNKLGIEGTRSNRANRLKDFYGIITPIPEPPEHNFFSQRGVKHSSIRLTPIPGLENSKNNEMADCHPINSEESYDFTDDQPMNDESEENFQVLAVGDSEFEENDENGNLGCLMEKNRAQVAQLQKIQREKALLNEKYKNLQGPRSEDSFGRANGEFQVGKDEECLVDSLENFEEGLKEDTPKGFSEKSPTKSLVGTNSKIFVNVRKRALGKTGSAIGERDCIKVSNPGVKVYSGKKAASFHCDNAFNEADSNDDIYEFTIKPFFGQFTHAKPVKIFFYPKKRRKSQFSHTERPALAKVTPSTGFETGSLEICFGTKKRKQVSTCPSTRFTSESASIS
jgi:hypothetical protein